METYERVIVYTNDDTGKVFILIQEMALDSLITSTLANLTGEYLTVVELLELDLATPVVLRSKIPFNIRELFRLRRLTPQEYEMIAAYVSLYGVPDGIIANPSLIMAYPEWLIQLILDRLPVNVFNSRIADVIPHQIIPLLTQQTHAHFILEYMLQRRLGDFNDLIKQAQRWSLDSLVKEYAVNTLPIPRREKYRLVPLG